MKCPRCRQDNPSQAKFCLECGAALRATHDLDGDLRRALEDAREAQIATREVLRLIASPMGTVEPVFDTILLSAVRLCGAAFGAIYRYDGHAVELAGTYNLPDEYVTEFRREFPARPHRGLLAMRAIMDGAVVQVSDLDRDAEFRNHQLTGAAGIRSMIAVPLRRGDVVIGAIAIARADVGRFGDNLVEVLTTFADQAVIAIENVRLFGELEVRNRELTTALDKQTATSDILRVISQSQTDVQPVFDAIVASAVRLLGAYSGALTRTVGDQIEIAAFTTTDGAGDAVLRGAFPQSLHSERVPAKVIRERVALNIADAHSDPGLPEAERSRARARGFRTWVAVPMLRHDEAIGTIAVTRREPGGFDAEEITLLQTFADQAVIAIENVRLFTELQTSNRDLTTALDTQTATADILRVISDTRTDVQPVFEAIVASAVRLLRAFAGTLTRVDGDQLVLAALKSTDAASEAPLRASYPRLLSSTGGHIQAIRDRAPVNIADYRADPAVSEAGHAYARVSGLRSVVLVPLLDRGEAIGAIGVFRHEPGGFTGDEIALLQTFADQAVIAIENARLLTELQTRTEALTRSVDQLTALGEVGQAVSSSLDLETVLTTIVARAVQLTDVDGGVVFEYDEAAEEFEQRASTGQEALAEARRRARFRKGEGVVGRTAITHEPAQVADITRRGAYESRLRESLVESGVRALLAVPMLREGHLVGSLVVSRNTPGDFPTGTVDLLRTFATQSALAIQNARLFREVEQKSRELEVASRHKSEFLANMSHELRTPLNAIIGYSELLEEEAGDLDGGRLVPDLQKIATAAKHQLSLINDILDLSKVEAGRMELELSDVDVPAVLDGALTLVRERAGRRGITLQMKVDRRVGQVRADERKVRQVVLNLLSNAIKFTPEGGRIEVGAAPTAGAVEVSVSDTGIGIAPEDQEKVFEEFRQVGAADKKVEGTGLGLALARKFVELHGGRMWVTSRLGEGATFTFTVPAGGG